jgi:ABC-type transport system involved in multi-copper enzyme maturation permease subunit
MSLSARRIRAVARKDLHEIRRNRSVLVAMSILPLIFLIQPLVVVFRAPSATAAVVGGWHLLLYMLGIPALVPPTIAAYAIAGERQQGSLEPLLTTPIQREELLLGKALAAWLPSIVIAYAVYALFIAVARVFAERSVADALLRSGDVITQLVFTPLVAGVSVWIGLAVSTRVSDVRVASQVSLLGSIPLVAGAALVAFGVVDWSTTLALVSGAVLLVGDVIGWRIVAPMFDRERLVAGPRS